MQEEKETKEIQKEIWLNLTCLLWKSQKRNRRNARRKQIKNAKGNKRRNLKRSKITSARVRVHCWHWEWGRKCLSMHFSRERDKI